MLCRAFVLLPPTFRLACAESGWDGEPSGEFKKFLEREESPTLDELIASLESTDDFEIKFSEFKRKCWFPRCDCAHTGGRHIRRWLTDEGIGPTMPVMKFWRSCRERRQSLLFKSPRASPGWPTTGICKDELLRCLKGEKVNTRPRRLLKNSHMPLFGRSQGAKLRKSRSQSNLVIASPLDNPENGFLEWP